MRVNLSGEFEDFPEDGPKPDPLPWREALQEMLAPYRPAASAADADTWMTTPEILSQLSMHFAVPGSDPLNQSARPISGAEVVNELTTLGFKSANIGGGGLHWLLQRKYPA